MKNDIIRYAKFNIYLFRLKRDHLVELFENPQSRLSHHYLDQPFSSKILHHFD